MHTHLSLFEGDANAFYEAGCPVPALEDRPPVHRGPAAARAGDHRGHQPVRQLVQAALGRRRGARASSAGATTTAPRSCACRCTSPARGRARASSTVRSTRRRTPTSRSRCCSPPGMKGIEEGYELPPEAEDDVWASATASVARSATTRCRRASTTPSSHGGVRARRRDPRRAGVQLRAANKRSEWRDYRSQVTTFELERNLEIL